MVKIERYRQDPDLLLRAVQTEMEAGHKGHLKIFFGYAAGVGKTYAMLKAAHAAKRRGIDVVAGYVEPHARPQTAALLNGLECLEACQKIQAGIPVNEFDIDAALKRRPQLILVDELAHTNAAGSRHAKRYQDIEELLRAGIDVYTTVNVQHIESLNDTVAAITGIIVRERIPDAVFDHAAQVELVDIEPQDLLERLKEGRIYHKEQALRAAENFFTVENLTALREFALRRCADRMNLLTESVRMKNQNNYHTDEHILVCLSSAPSNQKIIRTGARMAFAFRGTLTALFVQTPDFDTMSEENKKRLQENIRLAEQLGATIETVYGEDVPYQIAEFSRLSGVSKIVLGRSGAKRRHPWSKPALTEKLTAIAPNLDIYIIPDSSLKSDYRPQGRHAIPLWKFTLRDLAKTTMILLLATLIGFAFYELGFPETTIVTIYILGVLVVSIVTTGWVCNTISSIVSVLVFNFFFTVPRFTFSAYGKDYPVTFAVMFIVALLAGTLAMKLKSHARQSAQVAFRTKVLFETNQMLQKAKTDDAVIDATATQLNKLLNRTIVMYLSGGKDLSAPRVFPFDKQEDTCALVGKNETAVAGWVLQNNRRAGASTNPHSGAKCMYLAIRIGDRVYGVAGIDVGGIPLDSFAYSITLSILGECALALENIQNAKERAQAALLAQGEQLRANLLRSISHDLRTPLTSISGNASNLLSNGRNFDDTTKEAIYTDIYDDSMWLINLVENLLAVTRIEEGRMKLRMAPELVDEVITEALHHINRKRTEYVISVEHSDDLLLAQMDARLVMQVIINIVDNAIKYTPSGSHIWIKTKRSGNMAQIQIADDGPGIPEDLKSNIFDMFFTGARRIVDSRRSLGLGLSLCKSIITAHGGTITVTDNKPCGAVFTFTLPCGGENG